MFNDEIHDEYVVDHMEPGHRELLPPQLYPFAVCVARPVHKGEIHRQPEAQAALQKEWDRLRALHCWDEAAVVEWSGVARRAKRDNVTCHVGRIFSLCHAKNAELAQEDPRRKFKGRVVFQASQAEGQNWNTAMFQRAQQLPSGHGGC